MQMFSRQNAYRGAMGSTSVVKSGNILPLREVRAIEAPEKRHHRIRFC